MMEGLATTGDEPKTVMIDATYLKTHRTASGLRVEKGSWPLIGATKGGINTKLHAVSELPTPQWLLGDRGYDADSFRDALKRRASKHAFRGGNPAANLLNTTSAATGAAPGSRSCSDALKSGAVATPP
jgi:hypothetical protein